MEQLTQIISASLQKNLVELTVYDAIIVFCGLYIAWQIVKLIALGVAAIVLFLFSLCGFSVEEQEDDV
jgi:hypothetical protein